MRVILIKLADRLHNMRTLDHAARTGSGAIAQETRDIYAPLAHRLGIAEIKWELEDLASQVPGRRRATGSSPAGRRRSGEEREATMVEEVASPIGARSRRAITAEVTGRPKHFDSHLPEDGSGRGNRLRRDLRPDRGRVIIADSARTAIAALGVIHDLFTPVPDRFKDYIATPKTNLYQSLHTTVIGPAAPVEVQIRTREMHRIAEFGIAAHYRYKEGGQAEDGIAGGSSGGSVGPATEEIELTRASSWEPKLDLALPGRGLRVHPEGRLRSAWPRARTPVDFAYSIHTEVGHRCIGARVAGRLVPFDTPADLRRHGGDLHLEGGRQRDRPTIG